MAGVTRDVLEAELQRLQTKMQLASEALHRNSQERQSLLADGNGLSGAIQAVQGLLTLCDREDHADGS